jgi:1-acyl-sn-glycerol-3-phosphate acyltransferase
VFYLATRFNVPVVPVTMVAGQRHLLWLKLNRPFVQVTVEIGEPMYPEEFSSHATRKEAIHAMAQVAREQMTESIQAAH